MEQIDIINLIEKNPIVNFTGEDYQNRLISKITNCFTTYEQKIFLSSFYCYLTYDSTNDYVIDLNDIWKWLEFSSKHKAKELLEKYFTKDIDYLISKDLSNKSDKTEKRGGHNKTIIMLTLDTFKMFCLKAGTKKADEIHKYFVKLEKIMFETMKEECTELKQQILQINECNNKKMEETLKVHKDLEKEKLLLEKYSSEISLVYIIRVKTFKNGEYVIKIGESRMGVRNRYNEHKRNYEECVLLDCFEVDKSKNFESFIHTHKDINYNRYSKLPGHENEHELFLIGKHLTYQMVLNVIRQNISTFMFSVRELLKENELLKLKLQSPSTHSPVDNLTYNPPVDNPQMSTILSMLTNLNAKIDNIEHKYAEKVPPKITTGFNSQLPHLGPRVQKINPENLQLVSVYESVTEVMNENKNIKRPSIAKAIKDNTVYCGFRWQLVERNLDPTVLYDIQPTKKTVEKNTGYIAKLNKEKTEILNVYLDRKVAGKCNGYKCHSALDNPVKNGTQANGFYYVLYDNCDSDLTDEFESKYGTPLLYKDGIGKYDAHGDVTVYSCKYDCIRTLKMSDKTLGKALDTGMPYNSCIFKRIGEKLEMCPDSPK